MFVFSASSILRWSICHIVLCVDWEKDIAHHIVGEESRKKPDTELNLPWNATRSPSIICLELFQFSFHHFNYCKLLFNLLLIMCVCFRVDNNIPYSNETFPPSFLSCSITICIVTYSLHVLLPFLASFISLYVE